MNDDDYDAKVKRSNSRFDTMSDADKQEYIKDTNRLELGLKLASNILVTVSKGNSADMMYCCSRLISQVLLINNLEDEKIKEFFQALEYVVRKQLNDPEWAADPLMRPKSTAGVS